MTLTALIIVEQSWDRDILGINNSQLVDRGLQECIQAYRIDRSRHTICFGKNVSLCGLREQWIRIATDTGVMIDVSDTFIAVHRLHLHCETNALS